MIFYSLYFCLVWYQAVLSQPCLQNRKIFTEKTGIVTDGYDRYQNDLSCEWLIEGGPPEVVTIHFTSFYTECTYDYIHIHDGNSSQSPLLATISGSQTDITLSSTQNQVYILLSTDGNTAYDGFNLTYFIHKCPMNCSNNVTHTFGTCQSDGKCQCTGSAFGDHCQFQMCPNVCFQGSGNGICNMTEKKCSCNDEFYGDSCVIDKKPNTNPNRWYQISEYSSLQKRAGHVSEYISSVDRLFLFGGLSAGSVLDDLPYFDFKLNKWDTVDSHGQQPAGVSLCASAKYKDGFLLFGGELSNKSLSNELWFFNVTSLLWNLVSKDSSIPGHAGHALVYWNEFVYVIGGRVDDASNDTFSTNIHRFDMYKKQWTTKKPSFGKSSDMRLFGHTAQFYPGTNIIVIHGGYHPSSQWKISKMTNKFFLYDIVNNIWDTLPTIGDPFVATAFHKSVIAGNYFITYGGFSSCGELNGLRFFNLDCNQWTKPEALLPNGGSISNVFHKRAIYSHSMTMKDHHTLLITGGFDNIQASSLFLAYKLPLSVVMVDSQTNTTLPLASHCKDYINKEHCLDDPNCQYCDGKSKCHASAYPPSGCSTSICSTQCSVFTTCEVCSSQGRCQWCPLDSQCYDSLKASTACKEPAVHWWNNAVIGLIRHPVECAVKDTPPGLTEIKYSNPPNYLHPEAVRVKPEMTLENDEIQAKMLVRWKGKIHPFLEASFDAQIELYLRYSSVNITMLVSKEERSTIMGELFQRIRFPDSIKDETLKGRPDFTAIFPVKDEQQGGRDVWYNFDVWLKKTEESNRKHLLFHAFWINAESSDYKLISFRHLEPLAGVDSCSQHRSCMGCLTDASCGWCVDQCVSRNACAPQFIQHRQEQCFLCQNYFTCNQCNQDQFCAWQKNECKMKHLVSESKITQCHDGCTSFETLESCVEGEKTGCFWCSGRQKCLSFADYHPQNLFSDCYRSITSTPRTVDCNALSDCASCIKEWRCGWCFNENNPLIGSCSRGDFTSPKSTCSNSSYTGWRYDRCPDVNECQLDMHTCKANSTCHNIDGSYDCPCDDGFDGDGKLACNKTCWPACGEHGTCDLFNYQCVCDLGWKGANCSIDCGCNGHSTCLNRTDLCDFCQDFTMGDSCQYCVNGSYGNATTSEGCQPCKCNGNGDVSRNLCDQKTGQCYCVNNTDGFYCEKCADGFVYDPKIEQCVLDCQRSNIHKMAGQGVIVAHDSLLKHACHWTITAQNLSHNEIIYNTQSSDHNILLHITKLKTSCFDSYLNIFDGVPPNPRTSSSIQNSPFKLLASLCGPDLDDKESYFRSQTGVLTIVYEGNIISSQRTHPLNANDRGFQAIFQTLKCEDDCMAPFVCDVSNKCLCPTHLTGHHCQFKACPHDCKAATNQGICDQETKLCRCKFGFSGVDCANESLPFHLQLHNLASLQLPEHSPFTMYGSSMEYYNNKLYLFGNTGLSDSSGYFTVFDLNSTSWSSIDSGIDAQPNNRIFHCSFIFQDLMYIHGGVDKGGPSDDLWTFNFTSSTWKQVPLKKSFDLDVRLSGHTCTKVELFVYLIGGYAPSDGLSEFVYYIDLASHRINVIKFNDLEPVGIYLHVAIYDKETDYIYLHGGVSFYDDEIKPSNQMYAFRPGNDPTWNYIEALPDDTVPTLVGHAAIKREEDIYVLSGYDDLLGFNKEVYVWKFHCNRWFKYENENVTDTFDGLASIFASVTLDNNNTFYVFTGYQPLSINGGELFSLLLPNKPCSLFDGLQTGCLKSFGCRWCPANQSCADQSVPCENSTLSQQCNLNTMHSRGCDTFSTCSTCLSKYAQNNDRCHWCKCGKGAERVCLSNNQPCPCALSQGLSANMSIVECHKGPCYTSTCMNCHNQCFWGTHFQYITETDRRYDDKGNLPYNCFTKVLVDHVVSHPGYLKVKDQSEGQCPATCDTFKTCTACIASRGDLSGSTTCVWSEKLSQCMSTAILPLYCPIARCGSVSSTTCPVKGVCSRQQDCASCSQYTNCGWCSKGDQGYGTCMEGDFLEPFNEICGSGLSSNGRVVDSGNSANYTWAYMQCPLENECTNGHSNCTKSEVCRDLIEGYQCTCKVGYKRVKGLCEPVCDPECENGECVTPNQCHCSFGWTGQQCNVSCMCNGHSNCLNETFPDVCLACQNDTQGAQCTRCKPLFVGSPRDGGSCQTCQHFCNGNSDICLYQTQQQEVERLGISNNRSALLEWITENVGDGPKFPSEAVCLMCGKLSSGETCDECVEGYYKDKKSNVCVKCNCNGHGNVCNKDGLDCQCLHNTRSNTACEVDCQNDQCSKCIEKDDYIGNPVSGNQCYKRINAKSSETLTLSGSNKLAFFAVAPSFTNVNIRINIDVLQGSLELFIADENQIFKLEMNGTQPRLTITRDTNRARRSMEASTNFLPSRSAFKDRITTFENFETDILWIYNIEKRVVIKIDHTQHNLRTKKFYFVLLPTNKTGSDTTKFHVYFRQDLPRIDLLLFFLVLSVILLFILSGFIIGMKVRIDFIRNTQNQIQQLEMNAMQSRPLASYPLLFTKDDQKPHHAQSSFKNENRINKKKNEKLRTKEARLVLPLAEQETEDGQAAIVSVVVQFPKNEISEWNCAIGSGLCQVQNQHLLHIRASESSSGGRKVQTIYHATQIHS